MSEEKFSNVTHYTHVDVQPGAINIQHVEHLHQADILKALGVELEVKKTAAPEEECPVPDVLERSELWQRVKDAGWVDEKGQPIVSRTEAALIADMLASRLKITNKWKVFERLWHRNNMRNDYNTALEQKKSLEFQEKLKTIFG